MDLAVTDIKTTHIQILMDFFNGNLDKTSFKKFSTFLEPYAVDSPLRAALLFWLDLKLDYLGSNIHGENFGFLHPVAQKSKKPLIAVFSRTFVESLTPKIKEAMQLQKSIKFFVDMEHVLLGLLKMELIVFPVVDCYNRCEGFMVSARLEKRLIEMDFSKAFRLLHVGHAHLFIKQAEYDLNTPKIQLSLTARQMEIILYLFIGNSAKTIAKKMSISPRTVESSIARIKEKVDCSSSNELIKSLHEAKVLQLL